MPVTLKREPHGLAQCLEGTRSLTNVLHGWMGDGEWADQGMRGGHFI